MKHELSLIIATAANCPELASFNKDLIDCGGSNNSMSVEELENRMHDFISSGFIALIFEVEGIHVGYTLIDKNKNPVFIRHFFIAEEYRRRRYGTKAFKKIVEFFAVEKIDLTVLCSNEVGYKFWTQCGFSPYETVMHYRK